MFFFARGDLMLRLSAQPLGIFTKPPRTIHLTQMVPFGEHSVDPVSQPVVGDRGPVRR